MNKLFKLIFFSLVILLLQPLHAQKNYSAGYIIKLNGDSINGLIDYRSWESNPTDIYFKEKPAEESRNFKPIDIKRFGVGNEIYYSAVVKTDRSPRDLQDLQYNATPEFETDTLFLQTMFNGDKCLYFYKGKNGNENFYIKKGSNFELLIYKPYIIEIKNENSFAENLQYQIQLSEYFNDNPETKSSILNTKYNKNSLEKLYRQYYKGSNTAVSFKRNKEKILTEFGLTGGFTNTSLKFSDDGKAFTALAGANFNQSSDFTAGIFFTIILPRSQGRWSINNELMYSHYKTNGNFATDNKSINESILNTFNFEISYLKINNMLRFQFPVGAKKLFLFLDAGISDGFALMLKDTWKAETTFSSTVTIQNFKALDSPRTYEQGFIFGAGARLKRFSLEIRFENGNGMTSATLLKSTVNRTGFIIGYRF